MLDRVLALVRLALISAPLAAEAQPAGKIPRIAFISTTSSLESPTTTAFRQGLQDLGYVEGQNIIVEWRWGGGTTARLPNFAAEVIGLNVDVIVAANDTVGRAAGDYGLRSPACLDRFAPRAFTERPRRLGRSRTLDFQTAPAPSRCS